MVGGQRIPTMSEEQVKSLGHWFDESLKDINQAKDFVKQFKMISVKLTFNSKRVTSST